MFAGTPDGHMEGGGSVGSGQWPPLAKQAFALRKRPPRWSDLSSLVRGA